MILSAHFLVGGAIASNIENPILGIISAFLSHYLFDLIPVEEYGIPTIYGRQWKKSFFDFLKVFFDLLLGISLALLFSKNILMAGLGGFFAMIPDALILLFILFPKIKFLERHSKVHKKFNWFRQKKIPLVLEVLTGSLIYLIALISLRQP